MVLDYWFSVVLVCNSQEVSELCMFIFHILSCIFLKPTGFVIAVDHWHFTLVREGARDRQTLNIFLAFQFYFFTRIKQTKIPTIHKGSDKFFQNYEERKDLVRKWKLFLRSILLLAVLFFLILS